MKNDWFQYFLSIVIVAFACSLVVVLLWIPFPNGNRDILTIAVGAVLAKFGSVVDYFFGSSKGSADKTKIMSESK